MVAESAKLRIDDIIASIYDAALEPALWQRCYDSIRTLVGAETMLLTLQDPRVGDASLVASNLDPRFLQQYADSWWAKDAWMLGALKHPRGKAYVVTDIVPDAEWTSSEIYNELVKPFGNTRFCLGAMVEVDKNRGVTGFHRFSGTSDFAEADRRILQRLVPHIRQSLRLSQRLVEHDSERSMALAAWDLISHGILLVTHDARVVHANRAAQDIARTEDGLSIGKRGAIMAARSDETNNLHGLIARCASVARGGALSLARPSARRPLELIVTPLPARVHATVPRRASVLVLVRDPEHLTLPTPAILRGLYRFTAAEALLASELLAHRTLDDISDARGVGRETLRTQLKELFRKTGTHRQSELIGLLAGGLAAIVAGERISRP
jgi:DNA-binding CsgD family transcriptional regulator